MNGVHPCGHRQANSPAPSPRAGGSLRCTGSSELLLHPGFVRRLWVLAAGVRGAGHQLLMIRRGGDPWSVSSSGFWLQGGSRKRGNDAHPPHGLGGPGGSRGPGGGAWFSHSSAGWRSEVRGWQVVSPNSGLLAHSRPPSGSRAPGLRFWELVSRAGCPLLLQGCRARGTRTVLTSSFERDRPLKALSPNTVTLGATRR